MVASSYVGTSSSCSSPPTRRASKTLKARVSTFCTICIRVQSEAAWALPLYQHQNECNGQAHCSKHHAHQRKPCIGTTGSSGAQAWIKTYIKYIKITEKGQTERKPRHIPARNGQQRAARAKKQNRCGEQTYLGKPLRSQPPNHEFTQKILRASVRGPSSGKTESSWQGRNGTTPRTIPIRLLYCCCFSSIMATPPPSDHRAL